MRNLIWTARNTNSTQQRPPPFARRQGGFNGNGGPSSVDATQLTLALRSPGRGRRLPGTLDVASDLLATDREHAEDRLRRDDGQATPLNLTNHAYWNLEDGGATSVDKHVIRLDAQFYTPTDDDSIPTSVMS